MYHYNIGFIIRKYKDNFNTINTFKDKELLKTKKSAAQTFEERATDILSLTLLFHHKLYLLGFAVGKAKITTFRFRRWGVGYI